MSPLLVALVCLFPLISSAPLFEDSSSILELNEQNFRTTILDKYAVTGVMFYEPTQYLSKGVAPEFIKAATQLEGIVKMAVVNCAEQQSLCASQSATELPDIRSYTSTSRPQKYKGQLEGKKIAAHMYAHIPPTGYQTITHVSNRRNLNLPRILCFKSTQITPPLFKALSLRFQDRAQFVEVHSNDESLTTQYRVNMFPTLVLERAGVEDLSQAMKYAGEMTWKPIVQWLTPYLGAEVTPAALPSEDEFPTPTFADRPQFEGHPIDEPLITEAIRLPELTDQSCFEAFCLHPGTLCAILVVRRDAKNDAHKVFRKIGEERKETDLIRFVWVSDDQTNWLQQSFGIAPSATPQVVLVNAFKHRYAVMAEALTIENVNQFIDQYLHRRLTIHRIKGDVFPSLLSYTFNCPRNKPKTEEIAQHETDEQVKETTKKPKSVDERGTVVELTDINFDSHVGKSRSAWILFFYTQWSKPSFDVQRAFTDTAIRMKNEVKFGQIDCQLQDMLCESFDIHEYPTIKYLEASINKDVHSAKQYFGSMTQHALQLFAQSLLNDRLIHQVWDQNLGDFMGSATMSPQPRVLLFTAEQTVPSYFQALSYEYENEIVFGMSRPQETPLVKRLGVTSIPSIYILHNRGDINNPLAVAKYDEPLSYNHLTLRLQQLARNVHVKQLGGKKAAKQSEPKAATADHEEL